MVITVGHGKLEEQLGLDLAFLVPEERPVAITSGLSAPDAWPRL